MKTELKHTLHRFVMAKGKSSVYSAAKLLKLEHNNSHRWEAYSCPCCGEGFSDQSALIQHTKEQHKDTF